MKGLSFKLILLVLASLAAVILALVAVGAAPGAVLSEWLRGSLGTPGARAGTLRQFTPLLIAGVAVFVALRAGLFNIGVEGQFLIGALAAVAVALRVPGPAGLLLGMAIGAAAGAAWAWPAGWIKAYRGGHEVITTIMLNNVALLFTGYLVAGPLKDPNDQSATTATLPAGSRLPNLVADPPFFLSLAVPLGLVVLLVVAVWLRRTVAGYELNATGANPVAARFAGIAVERVMVRAMLASGAIAGLAGGLQALAYQWRFFDGFSPGYGFDALGVALLAGGSPWGIIPGALLFGVLGQGSTAVGATLGVPKGIGGVLLGLLIIVFAAVRYRERKSP
jgi:simple sugar transport system permease protein